MSILEFPTDRRKQPLLIPISRENYIVASIGKRNIKPRSEAAIGKMHACRPNIENKFEAVTGKSVCEFDILGATKVFIETTGSHNAAASKRGISGVELPRSRLPIPSQHGVILFHQHLLLPTDPRSHLEALRCKQRPEHYDIPTRLVVRTGVFLQQLRLRHKVVINEDNIFPDSLLNTSIAGGGGTLIGLLEPPQPYRAAVGFQIGARTVGRAVRDYNHLIGVRRVDLLLKGSNHVLQSSKTIVRRYYNTEEGAVHFVSLDIWWQGTRSPEQGAGANASYSVLLQTFSYHNAGRCYYIEANLLIGDRQWHRVFRLIT